MVVLSPIFEGVIPPFLKIVDFKYDYKESFSRMNNKRGGGHLFCVKNNPKLRNRLVQKMCTYKDELYHTLLVSSNFSFSIK